MEKWDGRPRLEALKIAHPPCFAWMCAMTMWSIIISLLTAYLRLSALIGGFVAGVAVFGCFPWGGG